MVAQVDVVIVGGGVAGLATATMLGRQGLSCVVVERARTLGGRAATSLRDGFHMNLGGHALYRGGPAERLLGDLGVPYRGAPPATGAGVAVVAGTSHVLPTGLGTLLKTGLFGARGKLEYGRLLTRLPKLDLRPLETVSLSRWLDETLADANVRATVEALVRLSTYAHAPERVSAAAAIRQLRLAAKHGVLYLDGGWQTLVDGLATVATRSGVRIATAGAVEEVSPETGGWRVQTATGERWRARSVVLAVGPKAAHKMVVGPASAMLDVWASACVPARAACLDLGLRTLPRPATTFALGVDAPLYFSVHSNAARLAPGGHAMIHAMKYLSPDDDGSADGHARELDSWLDLCQPGWRDALVTRRYLPDMIATNDIVRVSDGGGGGAGARPGPSVPCADGLFVVGDWVGSEGMLVDASLASAAEAARLVAFEAGAGRTLRAAG
jgi:phytoene dehydrogenase-like protein